MLVGAGRLVEVLRRRGRAPVAVAVEHRPVGGVLDGLLCGDVDRGIHHRRLDQRAFAGSLPVVQRQQEAVDGVQPGFGVTDGVRLDGGGRDGRSAR